MWNVIAATLVFSLAAAGAAVAAGGDDTTAEDKKRAAEQQAIYDAHQARLKAAGLNVRADHDVLDYQLLDAFPKVVLHTTLVHDKGVEFMGYFVNGKRYGKIEDAKAAFESRGWSKADAKTREQIALEWVAEVIVRNSAFRAGAKNPPKITTGKDGTITIVGEIEVQHRSGPWGQNLDGVTMEPRTVVVTKDAQIK